MVNLLTNITNNALNLLFLLQKCHDVMEFVLLVETADDVAVMLSDVCVPGCSVR